MIPLEWRASERARPTFSVAAIARDVGPRRLLTPTSQAELAAFTDLSLNQFVSEMANALLATGTGLFGQLEDDPLAGGDGVHLIQTWRAVVQTLAVTEDIDLAAPGLPLALIPGLEVSLSAVEISLSEGSLITKVIGGFFGAGAGLSATLFLIGPELADWHSTKLADHEIIRVTQGGRCSVEFAAELHIEELRRLAAEGLMKDPTASGNMERRRVCTEQVLLHMNGAFPGKFDGYDGPMTGKAKVSFATKSGLTARDVGSLPYYEALVAGVQLKR